MYNSIYSGRVSPSITKKGHLFSRFQASDTGEKKRLTDIMSKSLHDKVNLHHCTHKLEDTVASPNFELEINNDTYLRARVTAELVFLKRNSRRMADTGDTDAGKHGLPMLSSQDKGNSNKRKFMSEFSLNSQFNSSSSSSMMEFPRYEVLEEKSSGELAGKAKEELELSKFPEWKDLMIPKMEKILIKNLSAIYRSAIKKIVERGYSEEISECAVLRSGPYFGSKDIVSNIVDGALDYLGREKKIDTSKCSMFENFERLMEYTMLEMTCVLMEVNPSLSVADAMWSLLIFDLNLPLACAVEGDPQKFLDNEEVCGESLSDSTLGQDVNSEGQKSESNAIKQESRPELVIKLKSNEKENGVSVQVTGGGSVVDSNTKEDIRLAVEAAFEGVGKKGCVHLSKKDLLRQKTFQFEKGYKGCTSKGAFKAKLTSWGVALDKKPKSAFDSVNLKNFSMPPEANSKIPIQEKEKITKKPLVDPSSPPKTAEYYYAGAGISYDESQGKYVAKDEKDEIILAVVSQMEAQEKEVKSWNEWANEKVMQATRRIGKDQAELKALKLEKEETEKLIKEKHLSDENTVKRLSEMEHALTSATSQTKLADSTVHKLETEKSVLEMKAEDAKEKLLQEAAKLEKAVLREGEALKKSQSNENEKASLQEELTALKGKTPALQQGIEKSKAFIDQYEVQRAYEEREKMKFLKQADNKRKEKERIMAMSKAEEERNEEKSKKELQKHKDEMTKMKEMISRLKLQQKSPKKKSFKRLAVFQNNFADWTLKQEHECVMCLAVEKSVVFLPCSHQVLCVDCNVIHEKKGMKDCPSCRTPIQKRINASFVR